MIMTLIIVTTTMMWRYRDDYDVQNFQDDFENDDSNAAAIDDDDTNDGG